MGQLYSCCVTEICPGEEPPTPELLIALAPYAEAVDELRAAKDSAAACSACERLGDLVLEREPGAGHPDDHHSINPHKVALAVEADGVDAVLDALRDHHSSTDMNQMAFVTLDSFVRCSATTRPGAASFVRHDGVKLLLAGMAEHPEAAVQEWGCGLIIHLAENFDPGQKRKLAKGGAVVKAVTSALRAHSQSTGMANEDAAERVVSTAVSALTTLLHECPATGKAVTAEGALDLARGALATFKTHALLESLRSAVEALEKAQRQCTQQGGKSPRSPA